ncbi:hypothetical protein EET67_24785 [Pseudaminobacter arsenicus]|uniref:Transcriptional regulator n=1 Tax=Borborobacter arsenicus TaxID=1851146 RepID=A0A432UZ29_9HYPH|nr:hypothetical protein EET67_24785 [Pseudaminobacter arsenicus]
MSCEPAASIIRKFNGLKAVAEITGISSHSVMRWRYPRSKRGTGGVIPHRHADRLLAVAREKGIDLSPADFFSEGSEK